MHAQQSEKPEVADDRAAKQNYSDIAASDDQQDLRWWDEWGNADDEWGELDRSEQRKIRKKK